MRLEFCGMSVIDKSSIVSQLSNPYGLLEVLFGILAWTSFVSCSKIRRQQPFWLALFLICGQYCTVLYCVVRGKSLKWHSLMVNYMHHRFRADVIASKISGDGFQFVLAIFMNLQWRVNCLSQKKYCIRCLSHQILSDDRGGLLVRILHMASDLANLISNGKGLNASDDRREASVYACTCLLNDKIPTIENNCVIELHHNCVPF